MAGGHDSLAALFRELTELTILEEGSPNSFRARAYEKAMQVVASHRGDLGALSEKQLTALDGTTMLAQLPEVVVVARRDSARTLAAVELPEVVVVAKHVAQMVANDDAAARQPRSSISVGF